jgi:predicted AAA+ superfamily ATPase
MLLGQRNTDVGYILENIIYLELIRRGYDVYVGQVGDLEADFDEKDMMLGVQLLSLITYELGLR